MHRAPALLVVLVVLSLAAPARADDLEDFESAREAYDAQRYARAAQLLEGLVGGPMPRVRSPALVSESRKYLAASYLFLDRRDAATEQLALLLRSDPSYEIDPVAFPRELIDLFVTVRRRIVEERERAEAEARAREEAQRQEELARLMAERQRLEHLRELAEQEVLIQRGSRWIALIPFGGGQLQNGHEKAARGFGWTQGILAAGALGTFAYHRYLWNHRPDPSSPDLADYNRAERAARISNQLSVSLFLGVMVAGILDAEIRFVPERRTVRHRSVEAGLDPPPRLVLSVGLGGGALRLAF